MKWAKLGAVRGSAISLGPQVSGPFPKVSQCFLFAGVLEIEQADGADRRGKAPFAIATRPDFAVTLMPG
jgi:hypothetical protein